MNQNEPLPAVVQADADATTAAYLFPLRDMTFDVSRSVTAPGQAAVPIAKNTGKRVIIAWKINGFENNMAESTTEFWIVAGGPDMAAHYFSQEDTQAAVDAWLAGQEDAATYAVVYVG